MSKQKLWICFTISLMCWIGFGGCATTPVRGASGNVPKFEALENFLNTENVTDARFLSVKGRPYLKVDYFLNRDLEDYPEVQGADRKREYIQDVLDRSHSLGDRSMQLVLPRVPPDDWAKFSWPGGGSAEPSGTPFNPSRLLGDYLSFSKDMVGEEKSKVRDLTGEADLDRYVAGLKGDVEESIMRKGKGARKLKAFPLVPFVNFWMSYHAWADDRGPHSPEFKRSEMFVPPPVPSGQPSPERMDHWSLLQYYAPAVVQEIAEKPSYDPKDDHFGEVVPEGKSEAEMVPRVLSDKPAVYAYLEEKPFRGGTLVQLVYTLWYPEHPKLKFFDPEAGPMQGWTLRVTLDKQFHPVLFESVSNCGCYYKVFPTERLERMSREEYKDLLADKKFYIENHVPGVIDAVVPELVRMDEAAGRKIALFYSAGEHQLVTVRPLDPSLEKQFGATEKPYDLLPYETLENLPFNGYAVSLFAPDGLVKNGDRPECFLLKPTGMHHAGHARQRETQMIYFDQADFDDPTLLDRYLRLPKDFLAGKS